MYIDTFERNGKYGFKDGWRIILPARYEAADAFRDGYAIVMLNNKFGIINEAGDFVVDNNYDDLHYLFDKYYTARINNGKDWVCGVIDREGNIIIDFSYKCIQAKENKYFLCFSEAESVIEGLRYMSLHGRYSYSNQNNCQWYSNDGHFITSLDVDVIHDNYLIVRNEENKYGLIHKDARVLLNPKYDKLEYCIDGITIATYCDNGKIENSIIHPDGHIVFTTENVISFENGFFHIEVGGTKQWYSFEGNLIRTGSAVPLSKFYIAVSKNGKCGVIDYMGNRIINFLYDDIKYVETYFIVRRDNKIGLLGLKGEVIVDVIYDKIESVVIDNNPILLGSETIPKEVWGYFYYSGYCKEYCYDTIGHHNYQGKQYDRLKRQFVTVNYNSRSNRGFSITDSAIDLNKPMILSSDGKQELFTLTDGIVAKSKFDNIDQITPLSYVVKSGDKYGVFRLDTQSLIIPILYDRIQFYGGHTVLLCKDSFWGAKTLILDNNKYFYLLNVDIPVENIELQILDDFQLQFGAKKIYKNYMGEKHEYYTLLDKKGKEVEELRELYLEEQLTFFDKHHILSKRNGKYGFVSSLGFITLPFIYDEIIDRKTGGYDVRIGKAWGILDRDCRELVRVKYQQQIPICVMAPENSYFGYDGTKEDISKGITRFKDLFIVTDAFSGRKGCINLDGQEVVPTVFEHLMFNTPNEYDRNAIFEKDILFFGYGGYIYEDGKTFFSNVECANWGCINSIGQIIIEPKYDCFKELGRFLLAGRNGSFIGKEGNGSDYYDKYSGVYDLYNRDGELIIGGFREIYYDEQSGDFAIFFGGMWERYSTYDDDWNDIHCYDYHLNHKIGLWLIVDSELRTIIRQTDGRQYQLSKGFLGTIKMRKEDNKVTHLYNMPINLMTKGFSHFGNGCAFIKENNSNGSKIAALNLNSGVITPFYDSIDQIDVNKFFFSVDNKVGIRTFEDILMPPEYLLFTQPVNGYFFAVKEIDNNNSRVELFNFRDVSQSLCTAINQIDTQKLIEDIGYSRLKISFIEGIDLPNIQVPLHGIFDDEFLKLIHQEESNYMPEIGSWPSQWKDHYFFTTDYRMVKDDYYEPSYDDDDRDYMRDTWDAMTDGMYGDMPDGFDGDFDFLGR